MFIMLDYISLQECIGFNSLGPSDAYMRQQTNRRLVGAKPLSEPMLEYC